MTARAAAPVETEADAIPAGVRSAVNPWLVLGVVFLVSVAAVMAQFVAPPLMPVLMASFGIELAQASSLMSVFSITGVLLALPAGLVLGRFGPVVVGAVASGSVVVGSVMAASAGDYSVLLVARAVQGIGMALIGVTAPAVVAGVFPPERRGTPMGIWAMWVPVGGLVMYVVAPSLAGAAGWQSAWWLSAAVAAIGLVLWVVVLRAARLHGGAGEPSAGAAPAGLGEVPTEPGDLPIEGRGRTAEALAELREGLGGRDIWMLVAVFALFATAAGASNTFLATFLVTERGYDLTGAALITGLSLAGMAVGSLLAGVVSDRIGSRRRVYTGALLALGATLALPYVVDGPTLAVVLFVFGLIVGAIPSAIFASVPDAVPHPRLAGAGLAGINLGQNFGFVVGPLLFAAVLPSLGWTVAAAAFGVMVLVAALIGWRVRVR